MAQYETKKSIPLSQLDKDYGFPEKCMGNYGLIPGTPARHPNSARFHEILKSLGDLHDRKQADYGRGEDPFANVRASVDFGVDPWVGAMIRLNDKIKRLQSLALNGKLHNEAAEDSFKDIAVYAVIALVLFEQQYSAREAKQPGGQNEQAIRGNEQGRVIGGDTETSAVPVRKYSWPDDRT